MNYDGDKKNVWETEWLRVMVILVSPEETKSSSTREACTRQGRGPSRDWSGESIYLISRRSNAWF